MRVLLDAGADVTRFDFRGRTPLHRAAAENNASAVRALLDAGADPDWAHPGRDDVTPLGCAVLHGARPAALAELLVAGARRWGTLEGSVRGVEKAARRVYDEAPHRLPELAAMFTPQVRDRARTAALCLHRTSLPPDLVGRVLVNSLG